MTDTSSASNCPNCGEPVKPAWRLCPACETRLQTPACPLCGLDVKPNWRRCPECEALLVCPACGDRLAPGESACPRCASGDSKKEDFSLLFNDPVCGIEFVLVSGGAFLMGDTLEKGVATEQPVHRVVLDDFYMARHPVTLSQWGLLTGDTPSPSHHPDAPVVQVTWEEACDFCRRLTSAVNQGMEFGLPTEAQWEYAARSGGKDELYAGGANIDAVAWYAENSGGHPRPVAKKRPNGLGLYDMSGNVWEWCRDVYLADAYKLHAERNPQVGSDGPDRVIRGGGWNLDAWSARCARRFSLRCDLSGPALGFRPVMCKNSKRH